MIKSTLLSLLIAATLLTVPTPGNTETPTASASVALAGDLTAGAITSVDLDAIGRQTVQATAHHVSGEFSGVPLIAVLERAGAPVGERLRGRELANYVLVTAADGYRVVFALAELDSKFRDDVVLLVDQRDGKPLEAAEGPFRLVAPAEKRPGRWIRQVTRIELLRAPSEN